MPKEFISLSKTGLIAAGVWLCFACYLSPEKKHTPVSSGDSLKGRQVSANDSLEPARVSANDSLEPAQICMRILEAVKSNRPGEVQSYVAAGSLTYFLYLDMDSLRNYSLHETETNEQKAIVSVKINDMPVMMRLCRKDTRWQFHSLYHQEKEWHWKWHPDNRAVEMTSHGWGAPMTEMQIRWDFDCWK